VRNIIDNAIKYCGAGSLDWDQGKRSRDETILRGSRSQLPIGASAFQSQTCRTYSSPFIEGEKSSQLRSMATGLGLSLVKNIVEAHGGTIAVSSVPGEGSSFTLSLPAAKREPQ